jgi:hypothetical protein
MAKEANCSSNFVLVGKLKERKEGKMRMEKHKRNLKREKCVLFSIPPVNLIKKQIGQFALSRN